jgi:hypothetical protein
MVVEHLLTCRSHEKGLEKPTMFILQKELTSVTGQIITLDISPVWIPFIRNQISISQEDQNDLSDSSCFSIF